MCGIAGIWNRDGRSLPPNILDEMIDALVHRGPDAGRSVNLGSVGLAHRRLAIVDLEGGKQPMEAHDGRFWLTFNGEVFNYRELREELVGKGHTFLTNSDTEVVLRSYIEHGEACVETFNGQFAFAVWDAQRQTLFAARDRLGIRPFYYVDRPDAFVFASEVKAIFRDSRVGRAVDLQGLSELLTFWSPVAPRTLFLGVNELPPGHWMRIDQNGCTVRPYWQPQFPDRESLRAMPAGPRPLDDAANELENLLVDATRLRLRADVPVGAYLSGGLDSSLATALIGRFRDTPLHTFSVAFEETEFDEAEYQREVVSALNTKHSSWTCRNEEIGRVFPEVIWHTERAVLRTAPAPLFLLSRLVRERGFKVVMTGEGADEIFGGYDVFKEAKVRRFWGRQADSTSRPQLLRQLYPYLPALQGQPDSYLRTFFRVRPDELSNPFYSHLPRWDLTRQIQRFLAPEVRRELADFDPIDELAERLPTDYERWHPFTQSQYLETTGLLPGYILSSQGDRMAMAHSVEGRFPFLDHRVVEWAAKQPPRWKMQGLDEKHLLKRVARDLVPARVRQRSKQPYRAPDATSFFDADGKPRFPYVEEMLSTEKLEASELFQAKAVNRLVRKMASGTGSTKDNMALVGILSMQLLVDQFIHNSGAKPRRLAVGPLARI